MQSRLCSRIQSPVRDNHRKIDNNNHFMTGGVGLLDPAMHMELGSLEPGLVPYVAWDDRL
jgi:hypothetical protein